MAFSHEAVLSLRTVVWETSPNTKPRPSESEKTISRHEKSINRVMHSIIKRQQPQRIYEDYEKRMSRQLQNTRKCTKTFEKQKTNAKEKEKSLKNKINH